jgi:hypothetical protein
MDFPIAAALGFMLLGAILGIMALKSLIGWAGSMREGVGSCSYCGSKGWLIRCVYCQNKVAMCHYYGILFTDDPASKLVRARKSLQICTKCMPPEVLSQLERL